MKIDCWREAGETFCRKAHHFFGNLISVARQCESLIASSIITMAFSAAVCPAIGPLAARFHCNQLPFAVHIPGRRQHFPGNAAPCGRKLMSVVASASPAVLPEAAIADMPTFLDSLKWDNNGLVVAIAQHADTGEVLMQAFADREAVSETLQTG